jgi:hypothetical protein
MRGIRSHRGGGQSWETFLRNHAERTWACDFIQTYDLLFRQVYAFFIVHLTSRRVVHVAATRNPTQAWTAQQLRNALMTSDPPAILLRDRDDKFGTSFHDVVKGAGARMIRIAVRAPNMNAIAERFVGSVRREMLDHVLLLGDERFASLLREYRNYLYKESNVVVQDRKYFSCVANMILLPTPLKAFTDAMLDVKMMLRVCANRLYGWSCDHESVASVVAKVAAWADWDVYPESWPTPSKASTPMGVVKLDSGIRKSAKRRLDQIRFDLDKAGPHYPRDEVRATLSFWKIPI